MSLELAILIQKPEETFCTTQIFISEDRDGVKWMKSVCDRFGCEVSRPVETYLAPYRNGGRAFGATRHDYYGEKLMWCYTDMVLPPESGNSEHVGLYEYLSRLPGKSKMYFLWM